MPSPLPTAAPRQLIAALMACWLLPFPAAGSGAASELPTPPQTAGIPIPEGQLDGAIAQLDSLVADLLERSGVPGLAVAVVRGGETVYAKGFGVRKVGEDEAVDADTVFQLASMSKSIGATVVAHQVGAGVVDWDTPVAEHLPWFSLADEWVSQKVTIGDLYAHRSGLPDHVGDELEDLGFGRRDVLERLRFAPLGSFRAHYAYTNFGLTAAAEAVAVASGTDWASLSEEILYGPLGMSVTSSRFADFESSENRASGHVMGAAGYVPRYVRQPDAQSPAGGVSSSVNDMAKWMALVLQNGSHAGRSLIAPEALLPAITAQVISSPSYAADARAGFYGFGFDISIQPSGRVTLSHSGAFMLGAATTYLLIPSMDIGVVVLSNAPPLGAVEALAMAFADLAQYGEVKRDWFGAYRSLMAPMAKPTGTLVGEIRPSNPEPPLDFSAYTGRYGNDYFGDATIEQRGDQLVLVIGPAAQRYALDHWDGDVFTFEPSGENANPGSISAASFDLSDTTRAKALTIELLDDNGLGTFTRD